MTKHHVLLLVLSIMLIPSFALADGEVKAEEPKSTLRAWRPATDYVIPEGTSKLLITVEEAREPLAPWVKPLAISSAIGLVPGTGMILVAALKLHDAETPAAKDLWGDVMTAGIIVTGISFTGLLVAGAVAVTRPPGTQYIKVTPVYNTNTSGLMIAGSF